MKIHFGCFHESIKGWVNTDITPHLYITRIPYLPDLLFKMGRITKERYDQHKLGAFRGVIYHNITKTWKFPNDSTEAIFSSHVIEHLYLDQATFCFQECYRVLKKGGILRIAIPDLDQCIREFDPEHAHEWVAGFFESQQANDKNSHHWMYNERSLRKLLLDIGFSSVERFTFKKGRCPDVEIIDNRPKSLFIEAYK